MEYNLSIEISNKLEQKYFELIKNFINSDDKYLNFPCILPQVDRKIIHQLCEKIGIFSESIGEKPNRILTVRKTNKIPNKINPNILKQFVKDFELPITIFNEPYFSYFVELYDKNFDIKEKLLMLEKVVEDATQKNKSFSEYVETTRNQIISSINSTEIYKSYVNDKMENVLELPKQIDIYKFNEKQKYYISLDIVKANYNCMKYYNHELVLKTNSWEELVEKFTNLDYFKKAKYFRQVTFGNLKNKKAASIQKILMHQLVKEIKKFPENINIYGKQGDDELIIETDEINILKDYNSLKKILNNLSNDLGKIWKIEIFRLYMFLPTSAMIKEIFIDVNKSLFDKNNYHVVFKNINKNLFPQIYKSYYKLQLDPFDLKVVINGQLASFDYPII